MILAEDLAAASHRQIIASIPAANHAGNMGAGKELAGT
jgi:hypothetical protein